VESANEYEGSTQSGTQAREDASRPRPEQEVSRMGSWNPTTSEEPSAPSRTQASMFGRAGRLTRWTATKVSSGTFSSGRSVPLETPAEQPARRDGTEDDATDSGSLTGH
jgi:hypothetical protein